MSVEQTKQPNDLAKIVYREMKYKVYIVFLSPNYIKPICIRYRENTTELTILEC